MATSARHHKRRVGVRTCAAERTRNSLPHVGRRRPRGARAQAAYRKLLQLSNGVEPPDGVHAPQPRSNRNNSPCGGTGQVALQTQKFNTLLDGEQARLVIESVSCAAYVP